MPDLKNAPSRYTRREAIAAFLRGTGCFALAAGTFATSSRAQTAEQRENAVRFPHGVASGDPCPDAVVLWTRAVHTNATRVDPVSLVLQVAEDANFRTVVAERRLQATTESDFTARIIVHGLAADRIFFYRFVAEEGGTSRTGRTRTAPEPDADRTVRLAFASCQAYEGGYYSAYRNLLNRDRALPPAEQIDFILHLGDFIYEALGYGAVRQVPPLPSAGGRTETGQAFARTLEDYRHLYKVYLEDPDLQEARARWPFVVTWDDHEFSDDSWQSVSTYTRAGEPAQGRKFAANRAWFEFIPAFLSDVPAPSAVPAEAHDFRDLGPVENTPLGNFDEHGFSREPNNVAAIESLRIYRAFRWGRHLDLLVTDTRSYRSAHPVPAEVNHLVSGQDRYITPLPLVRVMDAGRTFAGGHPPDEIPLGAHSIPNPRKDAPPGTILGAKQKAWLLESIRRSEATWKVMATSVPTIPLRLDFGSVREDGVTAVFTIDTWEGYLLERDEIFGMLEKEGIANFVSLAGDHHANYTGFLAPDFDAADPRWIGAEFTVCGISSTSVFHAIAGMTGADDPLRPLVTYDNTPFGGSEAIIENLNLTFLAGTRAGMTAARTGDLAAALSARNPAHNRHLRYADTNAYGIAVVTVAPGHMETEYIVLDAPRQSFGEDSAPIKRTTRFRLPAWEADQSPALEGPHFSGQSPHPHTA